MRYNRFSFLNKSARYIGVLVGAAMIAALGMPSAAQAQTPAAPTVKGTGDGTVGSDAKVTASWGNGLGASSKQDEWLLEYTEPGVAWDKATPVSIKTDKPSSHTLNANDPRIHHGVWRFRVSYYEEKGGADEKGTVIGTASAITDYQHGPPTTAPTGFTAYNAGPDARRLVWDAVKGTTYNTRYTADATDDDAWTKWEPAMSGDVVDDLKMGTEYTFEVRALGATRAGVGDLHGPSASTTEMMPTPTPTLPEWGALFLALLLVGGGAYIIRRRQAQALIPA